MYRINRNMNECTMNVSTDEYMRYMRQARAGGRAGRHVGYSPRCPDQVPHLQGRDGGEVPGRREDQVSEGAELLGTCGISGLKKRFVFNTKPQVSSSENGLLLGRDHLSDLRTSSKK